MMSNISIETIWQDYRSALLRFLSSKVSNPTDVEDLLQSILIKTHQNLKTLKASDKIKPWLFQIANRTIIDFYRKQGSHHKLSAEDLWYETYEENELVDCILPFIECLPDEQARLIRSIELEGQSQKDYAAQNNISYSTLKSRVQKSRQDLKQIFEQCCTLELDGRGNAIACSEQSRHCGPC